MAELVGRGSITIAVVSDGYTISLTTATVCINSNYDGSNLDLSHAYTNVVLSKGGISQYFTVTSVIPSSDGITYTYTKNGRIEITGLSKDILSGYLDINIQTVDGYKTSIRFSFAVVRDTAGVEWISEWDGTHTQIGENYVITPKIFAGHKNDKGEITGVYIGKLKGFIGQVFPFTLSDTQEGIYGYKDNEIVFYIDNNGAELGGWQINKGGIQTVDGTLKILSEGTIKVIDANKNDVWGLYSNGEASFAKGNVVFHKDGSASFAGKITSDTGKIGGWDIDKNSLYNKGIGINSANQYIAIANIVSRPTSGNELGWVKQYGGVAMFYTSNADYGLVAYQGDKKIFSAGANNYIAGWNFDSNSIYLGSKTNIAKHYTAKSGEITIGTLGLRGLSWYIDTDGIVDFAKGVVHFDSTGGTISGWTIDSDSIFRGTKNNIQGQFTSGAGSITIGSNGVRGFKWRLGSDGSGALGGGGISWDTAGNIVFDGTQMKWKGADSTIINAEGLFTGKISADNITAGTISSANIKQSEGTWYLNQDGSGTLANGNINWDKEGTLNITGHISATTGQIGKWKIDENGALVSLDSFITLFSAQYNSYIKIESQSFGGGQDMAMEFSTYNSIINLSASQGIVQTQLKSGTGYSTGTAYISPTGIFANLAGTQATSVTSGLSHRAAIVGLGFAKVNKSTWEFDTDERLVAGVYGRASNSGTAPAYGGYFQDLKACGLVLNRKFISDSTTNGYKILSTDSIIVGITNRNVRKTVYLPTDGKEGRIIIFKQLGQGGLRIDTISGQKLHDDDSENEYFDLDTGYMAILIFQVYYINSVRSEIWSFSKLKF